MPEDGLQHAGQCAAVLTSVARRHDDTLAISAGARITTKNIYDYFEQLLIERVSLAIGEAYDPSNLAIPY